MAKWLLVLAAVAALTWWASRPSARRTRTRKNIKMKECPRCGVLVEPGAHCKCEEAQRPSGAEREEEK